MVTRRCSERRFFLRPSPKTNQAFWYILGWAARKYNIGVVAACAMSNHYHLIVIDHDGRIPDFLRDFNSLLSRCINAHLGRWESLWDTAQTSLVELTDAASQLEKTTYVLTNPVKDHLVGSVDSWPGAIRFKTVSRVGLSCQHGRTDSFRAVVSLRRKPLGPPLRNHRESRDCQRSKDSPSAPCPFGKRPNSSTLYVPRSVKPRARRKAPGAPSGVNS